MAKKNKSNKRRSKKEDDADEQMEERFQAAETRPQFRSSSKSTSHQNKVVLDPRFASVLTDSRFQLEGKDKYGRKQKRQAAKEELSAFYTIQEDKTSKKKETDDDDDSSDEESAEEPIKTKEDSETESSDSDDDANEDPASRIAYLTALSRGELDMSSSSESEEDNSQSSDDDGESDDEDKEEDPVYGSAGILDPNYKQDDVEISYDDSPFLVATNLDWESVRAVDIFSILSSFVPPGSLKRVQVFQSDFGMERMEKDRLEGPSGLWKKKKITRAAESDSDQDSDSDDSDDDSDEEVEAKVGSMAKMETVIDESDFDPEKLRAYEASKLKYYFAVVEFKSTEHADIAYREVDGMEFEHSSSAIDLRTIPSDQVAEVAKDRPIRDQATSVPSNYEPPEFIVSALQQTNVQCTWDQGDVERERKLTRYNNGGWSNTTEAEDLKIYLASDASSDDDSEDERVDKSSKMRQLLGLDSGDENDGDSGISSASENDSDDESDEDAGGKTLKYVPGSKNLQEKIRNKLQSKDEPKELTPWEKYQEKRKQKRKERKQAARNKKQGVTPDVASDAEASSADEDDFFMNDGETKTRKQKKEQSKSSKTSAKRKSSNQELELLLAGEHEEEEARDYDIRGIQRMEKNKNKKLKGGRKRKEDKLAADVSGKDFKLNVNDDRFAAVLDGADDRFGIDKTDPNYKDTSAMREILTEQSKRRRKKRRKTQEKQNSVVTPNVTADKNAASAGANALSMLVQKIKTQVSSTSQ